MARVAGLNFFHLVASLRTVYAHAHTPLQHEIVIVARISWVYGQKTERLVPHVDCPVRPAGRYVAGSAGGDLDPPRLVAVVQEQ